ncbi:MAG: ABC transporter permease [Bacilli bacterium]|jgi:putative ABC transport system permease protein|nr:ABC transporter permease [Bacilli bacterium]
MYKIIFKLLISKIANSKAQFISLLLICAIGVAMYIGILDVSKMMQANAQTYFNKQKASDIEVLTPFEITQSKIDELVKKDNSIDYEKYNILDVKATYQEQEYIAKIQTNEKFNQPYLVKGKKITKDNECYVDTSNDELLNKNISIDLNGTKKNCKVVGLVDSPQYLSLKYRGYSSISSSKINLIIFTKNSFISDYFPKQYWPYPSKYNALSIYYPNKDNNNTFSKEYQDFTKDKIKQVSSIFNEKYLTSRDNNQGVDAFHTDSERIKEMAAVFPIIFFIVTILVSANAMTRNVQDDRMLMGSITSMGFTNKMVIAIYLIYSFLTTAIGCIIGFFVGFHLIPPTIIKSYSVLYLIPNIKIYYNFEVAIQAISIMIFLIILTTLVIAIKETRDSPAQLIRPKAPVSGKKILLEKFNFIWKRLKFLNKVNLRNIFRYKKRLFMSILAIMGCSGLLMTGLGIMTSVKPIISNQYTKIDQYMGIAYTNDMNNKQLTTNLNKFNKVSGIENSEASYNLNAQIKINNKNEDITIISPQNATNFNEMITMNEKFNDNSITITRKVAEKLNLKKGSKIKITYNDKDYQLTITNITDNYVGNYIYVNNESFRDIFNINNFNCIYFKTVTKNNSDVLKVLEKQSFIKVIDDNSFLQDIISKSLNSIENLVYIMIAFAGILVIVVTFSLTNINIIERTRELATLKVLGFYNREVSNYVLKENIIITIIGLIFGLVFGTYLHRYIMNSIEANDIYFITEQPIYNYIIAFVITLVFTIMVNILMERSIRKIDMVESLKSIE